MARINEHTFSFNGIEYRLSYYKNDKPRIFLDDQEFRGNKSELLRNYIIELGMGNTLIKSQTTQQLSTFVLNLFSVEKEKTAKQNLVSKVTIAHSVKSNNNVKTSNKIIANQKIEVLFNQLNWKKVKDKNRKKLLIIGCSDSKKSGGEISNSTNYFINNEIYSSLIANRKERVKEYLQIIDYEPNYLIYKSDKSLIKRNNSTIPKDYFKHCLEQGLIMPAIERYNGRYYNEILKLLYVDKNQNANLHILIISGLYGVVEFRDSIIDYHLEIKKNPFWTKKNDSIVHDAICNYIKTNQIDNEMVFYSLSQVGSSSYVNALKPIQEWKNIWITHDHGDTSVKFLRDYFLPLL
jgi:cytoplasmic iron level regulating protein YaaA (DUF328/UPF0246 family)